MDRQSILQRQSELAEIRAREETQWRDIAAVLRPDEVRSFDSRSTPVRDDDEIYDATPLYALDDFVGGLFSQATNPASRWFELTLPDKDLAKWPPVRKALWMASSRLYGSLGEAVSPFYSEVPSWFATIGAFGCCGLYSEERVGAGRIVDRAIPIGQTFIDTDADGEIDTFHRRFSLKGRQLKQRFGEIEGCRDDATYQIIHAVYPNPDYRPGRVGDAGKPVASVYCSEDLRALDVRGGYYEFPYHVPRWTKRAGTPWPSGPGHVARPDMMTLNEMERSHLVAGQFAAEPPILVHDEAVFTAADINPNAVLFGGMATEAGKRNVEYMERRSQLTLTLAQSEQRRNAIRNAFKYGIMQLVNRPQMTATEFLGFQEETLKLLGPHLVGIQRDGLSPFIARRFRILERARQMVDIPWPAELVGQRIEIEYVSPLARLLQVQRGRGALQWAQAVGQIAEMTQDLAVWDNVDRDALAAVTHEAFTGDPSLLVDPRQRDAIRAQRAAAQQQAVQITQAEQLAAIKADVAHADQAQTLAKSRTRPS